MALQREQIEVRSPGNPVPVSNPTTPVPSTDELTTGKTKSLPHVARRIRLPALILLTVLMLFASAYAVYSTWLVARTTITIVPASASMSQSISIDAVLGTPTPSQVQLRALSASSQLQTTTQPATGVGHQPAVGATGTLVFYNIATDQIVILAGTTFTGSDGVQVATDATIAVPAGNPPQLVGSTSVSAHAVEGGASGNIAALDVNSALSGSYNGIAVKNTDPFSGGQDAQTYPVVSRADITSAATRLAPSLTQAAQAALQAQLGPGEHFLAKPSCTPSVQAKPPAGQAGSQDAVTVQVSCRGDAYDWQQVAQLATTRFTELVVAQLGAAYAPTGRITTASVQTPAVDEGRQHFTLTVPVTGRWVYQFDRHRLQSLKRLLAGKSSSAASALLLNAPGIAQSSIQLAGWNTGVLPSDTNQIQLIIAAPRST